MKVIKEIRVKQWMTRTNENPIPLRTMKGIVLRETSKAIEVELIGMLKPSSTCLHCNRKLTHPVSLLYGLGPICGKHFHINPLSSEEELQKQYDSMVKIIEDVKWRGWIAKSQIDKVEYDTVNSNIHDAVKHEKEKIKQLQCKVFEYIYNQLRQKGDMNKMIEFNNVLTIGNKTDISEGIKKLIDIGYLRLFKKYIGVTNLGMSRWERNLKA